MDPRRELYALLKEARVSTSDFHIELNRRGHAIHSNTLAKYIGIEADKSPPEWMLAAARHVAHAAGISVDDISGAGTLDRAGALLPPIAPQIKPGKDPASRTVSCTVPKLVFDAIEQARLEAADEPSRNEMLFRLVVEGLVHTKARTTTPKARYACSVCGRITAGVAPEGQSDERRFPSRHNAPDGEPCAGNYRFGLPIKVRRRSNTK